MRCTRIVAVLVSLLTWTLTPSPLWAGQDDQHHADRAAAAKTATPIKHLVVIFDENISFDHYFATYPHAKPNLDGSVSILVVMFDP
jgi:phospholipase C